MIGLFIVRFPSNLVKMCDFQEATESLMNIILDIETPPEAKLRAKYKRSFAYPSMKDRSAINITKIVDTLARNKATIIECYGEEVTEEIKMAIGELSKLKNQLQTAKQFVFFSSGDPDTNIWNLDLKKKDLLSKDNLNYYEAEWLFAECYLYRAVREIFATKSLLNSYDPFSHQKTDLLKKSLPAIENVFIYLNTHRILDTATVLPMSQLQDTFCLLCKLSLWGNRFDLSLRADTAFSTDIIKQTYEIEENLLINDSLKVFASLSSSDNSDKIVDFVTDNAGIEILCDLCLADYLISRFHIKKINFRVKPIPWFISDVIQRDFHQTVDSVACHPNESFSCFGKRWKKYLDTDVWVIHSDMYWCLGKSYAEMAEDDSTLYNQLGNASLIVFKGDLNYRKLLQDINWDPTTPLQKAVGNFHPAPIFVLRTCKSDIICGLEPGKAEETKKKHSDWLVDGSYGIIQYLSECFT